MRRLFVIQGNINTDKDEMTRETSSWTNGYKGQESKVT